MMEICIVGAKRSDTFYLEAGMGSGKSLRGRVRLKLIHCVGEGWGHGEDREGWSRQRETGCDGREGSRDRGLMRPRAGEERRGE